MADPTINGTDLFIAIEPVLDEHYTNYIEFVNDLALQISTYIYSHYVIPGIYSGMIPGSPPVPSTLTTVVGKLLPVSITFANPVPFNYIQWIKNTLLTKLTWNLTTLPPHIITPVQLVPLTSILDILGDLSNLSTCKGFWALICDLIVWAVLLSPTIESVMPATATDGSSGTITWIPFNIPGFTHNFIITVHYDGKNQKVKYWLEANHISVGNVPQTVDVVCENKAYQEALGKWLSLKMLTKDCEFYKLQDDDRRILLTSGYNL